MEFSRYNITGAITGTEKFFVVNVLTCQADILDFSTYTAFRNNALENRDEFIEKGYLVDPVNEKELFSKKYREFIIRRDSDEVQIFFVPWYACNFSCQYCFQSSYSNQANELWPQIIDSFFSYIESAFSDRKKYITLFGGEPLLDSPAAKSAIENFLTQTWSRGLEVSIVTNGYTLDKYIALLSRGPVREIQITLDGTGTVHDNRRTLKKDSGKTFDTIVNNIDLALAHNLKVNVRMVVDKENLDNLPELSRFAINRGWTRSQNFKTQIGRNYELHHCSSDPGKLFKRIELYESLTKLIAQYPEVLEFHRPAYSLVRFLYENGTLPEPIFDSCPGCKTEWAFDYTGTIYSCTATVGNSADRLGTYYPNVELKTDISNIWKSRDITTIEKCQSCSVSLVCGGGCAAVARNQHGSLLAPDCRPVGELIGLGLSCYFKNEVHDE